jgi:cobalt-zinc-cadmium efflux system protein
VGHDHDHSEVRRRNRRVLITVLAMTAAFMVVELIGGLLTRSLALLSDAGHMLSDVAALALSFFAMWIAGRPANARKSFGYHRAEILVALINGVAITVIAVFIFWEAIHRMASPPEVKSGPMLVIASIGLVVNIIAAWLLHGGAKGGSLNLEGAFLHVMGDLLGSVGAVAAGIIMMTTGFWLADPLISFFVATLIVVSALRLIRKSVDVLLEGTPAHLDLGKIEDALRDVEGVCEVHDLHVWTITSGFDSLTAHLVLTDGARHQEVLDEAHRMLVDRFGLTHSTLQPEEPGFDPCGAPDADNGHNHAAD